MPSSPKKIYWDSCVFISYLQRDDGRYPVLRKIVDRAQSGEIDLVISSVVIAETVKLDKSFEPDGAQQAQIIADFFENSFIHVRSVDRAVGEMAAELCRLHGLRPADAIHVATALRWKCDALHTYDGEKNDGTIKSRKKYLLTHDGTIGSPALPIIRPIDPLDDKQSLLNF